MRYVGPREYVIDTPPAPPPPYWVPGDDFAGQVVVILGNGPSLATVSPGAIAGTRFIAVNSACRWAAPIATAADPLYFTDNSWHENRPGLAAEWIGPVITSNRYAVLRMQAQSGLDACRYLDVRALCEWAGAPPDAVYASSGHSAAVLAARMGAARVVLLGFDGRRVDGRTHWHGDYSEHGDPYAERFVPGWRALAPALEARGVELVNATPGSAIDAVPIRDLEACLS
jgi:hypothetical protein